MKTKNTVSELNKLTTTLNSKLCYHFADLANLRTKKLKHHLKTKTSNSILGTFKS